MIDEYKLEKKLGSGSYGDVYYTTKKNSNLIFATKKLNKKRTMSPSHKSYFLNEIEILKTTDHENIIKLHEFKNSENNFYMIMEYCNGGSLQDYFNNYFLKNSAPLPEAFVQHILRQIACGLFYLHKCDIIHRDLKLENILLHYETEEDLKNLNILNAKIKIIDFGFAKYLTASHIARSVCGSPLNMDPIILQALAYNKPEEQVNYNEKADIWSLGIIIYHMLIGRTPFTGYSYKDLYAKVDKGTYNIPKALKLSKQAISLINGLLQFEIKDRLSIDELIYHEFLIKDVKNFEYFDLNLRDSAENNIVLNSKEDCKKIWDMYKTEAGTNLSLLKGNLERNSIIVDEKAYKPNFQREIGGYDNFKHTFGNEYLDGIDGNNKLKNIEGVFGDLNKKNVYDYCNNINNNNNDNNNNKLQTENNDIFNKVNNYNYKGNCFNYNDHNNYNNNDLKLTTKNEDYEIGKNYYGYYNRNFNDNNNNIFKPNFNDNYKIGDLNKNKHHYELNHNFNNNYENINYKKSESNKDVIRFKSNGIQGFTEDKFAFYNNNNNNFFCDPNQNCNFNRIVPNNNINNNNQFVNTNNYKTYEIKKDSENTITNANDKYNFYRKESEKLHELMDKMKSEIEKDMEKPKPVPAYYAE